MSTPSQDYDDSYCIKYAKDDGAYIVTNDRFRDYIEKSGSNKKEIEWLRQTLVSFAFSGDGFMPNPDSDFAKTYLRSHS